MDNQYVCNFCDKIYHKRKRLQNHVLKLHKVVMSANSEILESSFDSCTDYESDTQKTSISAGGVTKSPANISLNKKESNKDSSTDSGNKKQLNQAQLGKVIAEKKNESSSDSSSSEEEKGLKTSKIPLKVAISSKQSPKVAKKSSPELILLSSSNSEDDVPKIAAKFNIPAKNKIPIKGSSVTLIQKIPPHNIMIKKDDSSDSSSDSEVEIQVQPKKNPNESGNWAPKISKFAAEFSDDSYSESERVKDVMVSLAKKVPMSKSPVTKQVSLGAGLLPSKLLANKQDASSDSSSESEETYKVSQMKNGKIPASVKTSVTALKRTVHDMSDSSDSNAGKGTNKSLNKKPHLTPKLAIATPSKNPAASIISKKYSSDSSSEEETSVNLLNKKNLLNKFSSKTPIASKSAFYTAVKPSPKKPRISTLSKKDSSDSSADSSLDVKNVNKYDTLSSNSKEELFKEPVKMPVPHPFKGVDASTQTEEISDSDAESEISSGRSSPVSSVHTSDLSTFDDVISLSSEDENGKKKTMPLKEAVKKYLN